MVLLLARCWEYKLKTEDVLELTQGNRRIALCTVVGALIFPPLSFLTIFLFCFKIITTVLILGLLEDGETYSTELRQRQKPGQGKLGQWEHELVCHRYEKPLILQISRLLRGFTSPSTYFQSSDPGSEIALYSIEQFSVEITTLLEITLRSRLVEKISVALYDCLMDEELAAGIADVDDDEDDGGKESERELRPVLKVFNSIVQSYLFWVYFTSHSVSHLFHSLMRAIIRR